MTSSQSNQCDAQTWNITVTDTQITEMMKATKLLSIKQPWLWAILDFRKRVENRSRRIVKMPGWVFLHASLTIDERAWHGYYGRKPDLEDRKGLGRILGMAEIISCDTEMKTVWDEADCFHWRLGRVVTLNPQRCKGGLGFYPVPDDTLQLLRADILQGKFVNRAAGDPLAPSMLEGEDED